MDELGSTRLIESPDDWWQRAQARKVALDELGPCVVGILASVRIDNHDQEYVYTGFVMQYQGKVLWVTAGHVIDNLIQVRASQKADIKIMRWLDRSSIEGAEAAQFHNRNLVLARVPNIDVGYAIIEGLDLQALFLNEKLRVVNEQLWSGIGKSSPEGYYLIGFPDARMNITTTPISDNKVRKSLMITLGCLPIQRIDHRQELQRIDFWNDPESFYGQIVPSQEEYQLESVSGMSGSPVFSVEREPGGKIARQLIGIQSKQLANESIVCIEPIQRAIDAIRQKIT